MELERQAEPLTQRKSWSELTEGEREAMRESCKRTLPEEFDVFCIGDFINIEENLEIPGNFYVKGDVLIPLSSLTVDGHFISDGDINTGDIKVHGDCIIRNYIDSCQIDVDGLLDCYDINANGYEIHAADFVCRYYEEEI